MCGIYFHAKKSNCFCFSDQHQKSVLRLNRNRGPNDEDIHTARYKDWELQFNGFLLWLRGSRPQVQPLVKENGNVLLWNGDVFNETSLLTEHKSDTESIANRLSEASSSGTEILKVFTQLEGPGAFVFYHQKMNTVWFGRDILGRHSLLIDVQPCHCILTSVAFRASSFNEVEALGIYQMNLNGTSTTIGLSPWANWKSVDPTVAWTVPIQYYPSITSTLQTLSPEKLDIAYTGIQQYLDSIEGADYVHQLQSNLEMAVSERMQAQPKLCKNCCLKHNQQQQQHRCIHCKTAILFSGGLDSTILALLAAKQFSDTYEWNVAENVSSSDGGLDLINVAFQQPDGQYDVPDRVTALQAFEEIQSIYPSVSLNLVLVNVTKAELQEKREDCIRDLLHPLDTVLDDSIGCAIWFAARAKGVLVDGRAYTSPARVMLLGMGADEQLGGYSKHQAAFKHEGRDGLLKEVQRQIHAISQRNLGRDNRVVSHHGVAGRYPFLDERVIGFLSSLPLEAKMNLSLPRGIGDKIILRALAFSLGLAKTSVEPKRAIQFGSRIAKLENKKEKARDKAVRS